MLEIDNVVFKDRASDSIDVAAEYYLNISLKVYDAFFDCFVTAINSIVRYPLSYAVKYDEFREAPIANFPYLIIYKVEEDQIIVFDIFNTHQDPEWKPNP